MRTLALFIIFGVSPLSPPNGMAENPPNPQKSPTPATTNQVECTIPVLPVRDLTHSIAFYRKPLGFKLDWGGTKGDTVCSVSRDKRCIMLLQKDKIESPAWVWIGSKEEPTLRG